MATLCGTRTIKRLIFKDRACRARLTVQGVSGTPLDATKRASRIGPFCTMNHGSVFVGARDSEQRIDGGTGSAGRGKRFTSSLARTRRLFACLRLRGSFCAL
jgi:hypothetical protein